MANQTAKATEVRRGVVWMLGLACASLAALMPPASLLLIGLLAPSGVALVLDRQPGRPVTRVVFLCGLAASITPLRVFFDMDGESIGNAFAILGDSHFIAMSWSAAAGGWLLSQLLPIGLRGIFDADSVTRAAFLSAEREKLAAAWGLEKPEDHAPAETDASAILPPPV